MPPWSPLPTPFELVEEMEHMLKAVLIQALPSCLGQTENNVEELQMLVHTNSMSRIHNSYANTHSSNV